MAQIFIVDDSISVRKALEITFKRHALSSLSAVSGEEALETLLNDRTAFDLLMVDVVMPGMSGLELCATLRQQARFQTLPVILMSGNIDDEIRQRARDAGATAVLRKPFSPDELMPMVEGLLASRGDAAPVTELAPAATLSAPAAQANSASAPDSHAPGGAPAPAAGAPQPAREPAGPSPAVPEAQEPHGAQRPGALDEAERLITHYRSGNRAEALALLNAQHQLLGQVGQALDPRLLTFAGYFVNTARVIGQQVVGEPLQTVTLRYAQRDVILHVHQDFTLVVLTRAGLEAGRVLH